MKTGIFVRLYNSRTGRWENTDVADMREEDFAAFIETRTPQLVIQWAIALQKIVAVDRGGIRDEET